MLKAIVAQLEAELQIARATVEANRELLANPFKPLQFGLAEIMERIERQLQQAEARAVQVESQISNAESHSYLLEIAAQETKVGSASKPVCLGIFMCAYIGSCSSRPR